MSLVADVEADWIKAEDAEVEDDDDEEDDEDDADKV